MKNINDILIVGSIASDVEVKSTEKSTYAKFSVSCTKKYFSNDGQVQFSTSYVNVIAWGKLAEKIENFKKGDNVIVQGRINVSKYETEEGEKRSMTNVVAYNVDRTKEQAIREKHINKALIYGYSTSIDESRVREIEGDMVAIKTSIAVNDYIKKADAPETGSFDDRFETITTFINIRFFLTKKFYEDNFKDLVGKTGVPMLVEGSLLTRSYESEDSKKLYYTYVNVSDEGLIAYKKGESNYNNDDSGITDEELKEEFSSKEVKKEEQKVSKSRFEEDDEEEVNVEDVPF